MLDDFLSEKLIDNDGRFDYNDMQECYDYAYSEGYNQARADMINTNWKIKID